MPISLLLACGGGGPDSDGDGDALTREEAAARVIDELVTAGDAVVVLGLAEPVAAGDRIVDHHPLAGMVTEVAVTAESESWFFWLDDEPGARFDHPSRYAMVDRESGEITVVDAHWWPLRDGAMVWDDAAYDSGDDRVYADLGDGEGPRAGLVPDLSPFADCTATGGHAVVINGVQADEKGKKDFDNDGANMKDALTDAGLDTTYFGPAGSENVDQTASTSALETYFAQKADELEPGDTLVVYVGGHGWVNDKGDLQWHAGETQIGDVWEKDLERWLSGIDPGVNVVVIIDGCHSGGMLDSLTCVADLAVSATDEASSSYGDLDLEGDPNPQDNGGEWTSSMLTCWNTLMDGEEARAGIGERATAAGTNFFTQLVGECFDGAGEHDAAQKRGWTKPQRVTGAPKTAIPQTDPQPPVCDPTDPDPDPDPDPACSDDELALIAQLLGMLIGVDEAAVCDEAVELEEGNETLHSDGEKTATAEGNVDGTLHHIGVDWQLAETLKCGGGVVCPYQDTGLASGTPVVAASLKLAAPLEDVPTHYYQYGFVFDVDGDPSNNYQAMEPYPTDLYDDTDLWVQLLGSPGQPWGLDVVDARDGAFTPLPSGIRIVIDGDTITAIIPADLLTKASDMRFTAFVHEGDFGSSQPWSGDVIPPVDQPKIPLPQ